MRIRSFKRAVLPAMLAAVLALPASAMAAKGPPMPQKADGGKVKLFASGVSIPAQIAFSGKHSFVAGAREGKMKGGVFLVMRHPRKAMRVPGTVKTAYGIVAHEGRVYVSSGRKVIVYSKFNGKRFLRSKVIFRGGKDFFGFGGLAIGPDHRLYAGAMAPPQFDHTANTGRFGNSVVSMRLDGRKIRVVSTGMRQPWMMTFAKGGKSPFVSVLAQDLPANNGAPDLIVKAVKGSNFGFPECSWLDEAACAGFTRPTAMLDAWAGQGDSLNQPSPMGIGTSGKRLYVALFSGMPPAGPQIATLKTDGTGLKPFVVGFVAPVMSVTVHHGRIYAGDLTGRIYTASLH